MKITFKVGPHPAHTAATDCRKRVQRTQRRVLPPVVVEQSDLAADGQSLSWGDWVCACVCAGVEWIATAGSYSAGLVGIAIDSWGGYMYLQVVGERLTILVCSPPTHPPTHLIGVIQFLQQLPHEGIALPDSASDEKARGKESLGGVHSRYKCRPSGERAGPASKG